MGAETAMMEWAALTWAAVSGYTLYAVYKPDSDLSKIKKTFHTLRYQVKDHKPSLAQHIEKDAYQEYVFNVPYGLIDDPKLEPAISKTLNKRSTVFFDGKLHIRVYETDLPTRYDYEPCEGLLPIGITHEGTVYHDFDKHPHMTIAGTTRYGKTVLLKLIFAHLIHTMGEDVEFYIVDLKGGLEFDEYKTIRQVKGIAGDKQEAVQIFKKVSEAMRSRMSDFKTKGYKNTQQAGIKRRTFVFTDEGAELAPDKFMTKEEKNSLLYCQHVLSEICRIGAALGFRNIYGTQYPHSDNLPRQVKQNSDARVSFRLKTEVASRVALDDTGAERLVTKGRAIYSTDFTHEIQVPFIDDKKVWEIIGRYKDEQTASTVTEGRYHYTDLE